MLDISLDPIDQRRLFLLSFLLIWLIKCIYLFSALNGLSESNYTALFITLDTLYFTTLYTIKIPILYTGSSFQPLNIKITTASILIYGFLFNLGMRHYTHFTPPLSHSNPQHPLPTTVYNPRGHLVPNDPHSHASHSFYGAIHGEYLVSLFRPSRAILTKTCDLLFIDLQGHGPWHLQLTINHQAFNTSSNLPTRHLAYNNISQPSFSIKLNSSNDYGLYTIQLKDHLNLLGKSNATMMVPCPIATLQTTHGCQFSNHSFQLHLRGAHPIQYSLLMENQVVSGTTAAALYDTVILDLFIPTLTPKTTNITLLSLLDAYTNSVTLNNTSTSIHIYPIPTLQFATTEQPIPLQINQQQPTLIDLLVDTHDYHPFTIQYQYNHQVLQLNDSLQIPATLPGNITLLSIHHAYCKGRIIQPATLDLMAFKPPTLSVVPTPMKDPCFGQVALKLNTTLFGQPPFTLHYLESYNAQPKLKQVLIPTHRKLITLEPKFSGEYQYELTLLQDALYTDGIPLHNMVFHQFVHPKSTAQFDLNELTICTNKVSHIPISLTGTAPWSLSLEIGPTNRRQMTINAIEKSPYLFHLNHSVPGVYTYDLTMIRSDVNECPLMMDDQSLMVHVINSNPWVAFDVESLQHPLMMAEGSEMEIPIVFSTTGKPPFRYTVTHHNHNHTSSSMRESMGYSDVLKLTQMGSYSLSTVDDKYCHGNIASNKQITMAYYPKPTLKPLGWPEKVCPSQQPLKLELELKGSGIFQFQHELIRKETGQVMDHITHRTRDSLYVIELDINTHPPGEYTVFINNIGDDYYANHAVAPLRLHFTLLPLPTAHFHASTVMQCMGSSSFVQGDLELVMSEPSLQVEYRYDGAILDNLHLPEKDAGEYILQINKITDEQQCTNSHVDDKVTVIVKESPDILQQQQQSYCVGELMSFKIVGGGPFVVNTVFYPLKMDRMGALQGASTEWGNGATLSEDGVDGIFNLFEERFGEEEEKGAHWRMMADEPVYYKLLI